jgi:hypothetical protein
MERIVAAALMIAITALLAPRPVDSQEPNRCSEPPKVIEPVKSGPQFEAFRRWLMGHEAALGLAPGELGFHDRWDSEGRLHSSPVSAADHIALDGIYIADINNDGTDEYVMTAYEGSGGYLVMWVFRKVGVGFELFANGPDAPPKPKDITYDGPWFVSDSINPLTSKNELFVRVCGKVYISFVGSGDSPFTREGYLWEKGATNAACDWNWIEYNRGIFRQLYDGHYLYGRALEFMTSIVDQCGKRIEAKQRAWIYDDLALTEFRVGDRQRCLDYLGKASAEKEATAANPSLAKAISYNESLCNGARSTSDASR